MRLGNWAVLWASLSIVLAAVPLRGVEPPTAALQELLDVDQQRIDAFAKGDVTALERILAADLTYVANDGRIEDKQSVLFAARTKRIVYGSFVATERKARPMGTAAVVTGVAAMRGVNRNQHFDAGVRYTAMYARRDGRWQLVALQETPLPAGGRVIGGESATTDHEGTKTGPRRHEDTKV